MRYGTPLQTVLLVGASLAASMPSNCNTLTAAKADYLRPIQADTPPSFKRQQMLRGTGYAKQRREAKKRRRRR